jgi:Na+-translocating ferredoxin:NAD+ oxidoreductase RnfE subunit
MLNKITSLINPIICIYRGFLLAILPPGAFFGLALLIASKNWQQHQPRLITSQQEIIKHESINIG